MTNADIRAALQRDVAAANPTKHECSWRNATDAMVALAPCQICDEQALAELRLAALDGPALLDRLIEEHEAIAAIGGGCDGAGECMVCDLIADAGRTLGL